MKFRIALCLFLLAIPAQAAETIADQAKQAYELYAGGLSQPDYLSTRYGRDTLAGISGNWAKLNGPDPRTGIETYGNDTETACRGNAALTLASPNAYSMTLTTNLAANNLTQVYTLVAGATFAEHTDSTAYLDLIGLGASNNSPTAERQRALVLSSANGIVQIYRPSEDILVMTRERGYPTILARCPAP